MNARAALLITSLAFLGSTACGRAPMGPSAPLAGVWRTIPIPSGSGIDLFLKVSGATVTGTGHEYRLPYLADTLTLGGRQQVDGTFSLTVSYASGTVATYNGAMNGADQLDGFWTSGQDTYRLAFYRQQN